MKTSWENKIVLKVYQVKRIYVTIHQIAVRKKKKTIQLIA